MQTRVEFRDFAKAFLLSIGLYAIVAALLSLIPDSLDFMDGLHPSIVFMINYGLQFVIMFFPFWLFVLQKHELRWKDLGFRKMSLKKLLLWVILAYLAYMALSIGIGALLMLTEVKMPGYGTQESYVPFFGDDMLGVTVAVLFVVFIGPLLEEIFFRGFIYRVFLKVWPSGLASFLTAMLFALFHLQPQVVIPLLIIGVFLNEIYRLSGSLWVAYWFHVLNNAVSFGVMFYLAKNPEILEQFSAFLYNTVTVLS